jgi:hypothetical protein
VRENYEWLPDRGTIFTVVSKADGTVVARTARGRADAKAKGVKFGRKPSLTLHQQREAIRRRDVDGSKGGEIVHCHGRPGIAKNAA